MGNKIPGVRNTRKGVKGVSPLRRIPNGVKRSADNIRYKELHPKLHLGCMDTIFRLQKL